MPSGTASTIIASQPVYVDSNGTVVAAAPQQQVVMVDSNGTVVAAGAQPTVRAAAAPRLISTWEQTQVRWKFHHIIA
jgi:hypothetical protein